MERLGSAEFFDTPLLIRALAQGRQMRDDSATVQTGLLNLYEVVHWAWSAKGRAGAESAHDAIARLAQGLTRDRILEAARLRVNQRHRGLSYADAMGYVTARELGIPFVTTDGGFKGLPGVRLV